MKKINLKRLLFSLTLTIGFIAATLCVFLRPSYSEAEKRELTKFPEFSFASLFDGSFFKGLDKWYSDTFPGRDELVTLNAGLNKLNGIGGTQISGNVEKADEIKQADKLTEEDLLSSSEPDKNTESTASRIQMDVKNKKTHSLGATLIVGDSAYEYYNFVEKTADRYARLVSKTALALKGKTNVYDIVIPTSIDIMLPDEIRENITSSDQKKAIDYIYGTMIDGVKTVDIHNTLIRHMDEYIYFRTDHHWTATGAYYAYAEFMKAAGKAPVALSEYKTKSYKNFIGAFYTDTGKNPALTKNPDTVVTYLPLYKNSFYYIDKDGKKHDYQILTDVSEWSKYYKYSTFIGGDNPLSVMTNKEYKGKESCIVVKESYGNAFIPFLLPHYKKVYVVDYRYYQGSVIDLAEKYKVNDLLFLNNISVTRSESLVEDLESITK